MASGSAANTTLTQPSGTQSMGQAMLPRCSSTWWAWVVSLAWMTYISPLPAMTSTPMRGNLFRMSLIAVVACSRLRVERCSTVSVEKSYSSAPLQEMAGSERRMPSNAARIDSGGRPVATVNRPPRLVKRLMTVRLQAGSPSLAVSSVLSISQMTRVSLSADFMRDVPFLTVSETL